MNDTILLVEDDYALAMGTEYALAAEGYKVLHGSDLKTARDLLLQKPDLILLDVMLPDGTGYDLCKEIRERDVETPIIFLTAVSEEVNIVQGLELGADDYVAKPYRVKELLSRISANLRRAKMMENSKSKAESYRFGEFEFFPEEFRLLQSGRGVECTPSELRLLKELTKNEGCVLSRTQLLERLYDTGEAFVDDNTLSVYMKRLRDKLGADSEWIETVRGVGYRFKKRGMLDEE